jgi:hypothetical protein
MFFLKIVIFHFLAILKKLKKVWRLGLCMETTIKMDEMWIKLNNVQSLTVASYQYKKF